MGYIFFYILGIMSGVVVAKVNGMSKRGGRW